MGSVDLGIVIALKEEFAELYRDLEQTLGIRKQEAVQDPSGRYYYPFEYQSLKLQHQYSCIATFVGEMGNTKFSLVTQNFINNFQPNTIIILGIAGALDSDVKIGDIFIATQVDAYLENSKAIPASNDMGYTFQRSGEVYRCHKRMINKLEHFEFALKDDFQAWRAACLEEFQLFLKSNTNPLVNDFLKEGLIVDQVNLKSGHLASGPTVGGSEKFKDWIKERDRKCQAIEMETAGFMAAVEEAVNLPHILVIRAISDYADERKKNFDQIRDGFFRRYSIHNALRLLWSLLETGILLEAPSIQDFSLEDAIKLAELLKKSGQASYSSRKALCFRIGVDSSELDYLNIASDSSFSSQLIQDLSSREAYKELNKICDSINSFLGQKQKVILAEIRKKLSKLV